MTGTAPLQGAASTYWQHCCSFAVRVLANPGQLCGAPAVPGAEQTAVAPPHLCRRHHKGERLPFNNQSLPLLAAAHQDNPPAVSCRTVAAAASCSVCLFCYAPGLTIAPLQCQAWCPAQPAGPSTPHAQCRANNRSGLSSHEGTLPPPQLSKQLRACNCCHATPSSQWASHCPCTPQQAIAGFAPAAASTAALAGLLPLLWLHNDGACHSGSCTMLAPAPRMRCWLL